VVFKIKIDMEKCVVCERCVPYCPVEAIIIEDEAAYIDQEKCVECGVCLRSGACKVDALFQPELSWPRVLRSVFSDPLAVHPETDIPGRGTEEMKTNDVTHRFRSGEVGIGVEMGRPGIATSFEDVEKVAMALAKHDVRFEPKNPVTILMDTKTGRFKDTAVRKERVLSAIIELTTKQENLVDIIETLRQVSEEIDTVMSVEVATVCKDSEIPIKSLLEKARVEPRINGKVNLGLALAWSYK
jgi:NAD-dependent dihydropyrimidine dehydrogenase PreA subunit